MASLAHLLGHVLRSLANKRIVDGKVESAKDERKVKGEVQWCRCSFWVVCFGKPQTTCAKIVGLRREWKKEAKRIEVTRPID